MPSQTVPKLPRREVLRLEDYIDVARAAATLGIDKFRITGGEPLIRRGVVRIIREIADLSGVRVLMTTNGQRLAKYALRLKTVGLSGVNVSLDSLDPLVYRHITRGGDIRPVLEGIEQARLAGLPLKINTVLLDAARLTEVERWLRFAREKQVEVRFIERMGFASDVAFVPTRRVLTHLRATHTLTPAAASEGSPHVQRYNCDGARLGFISPRSDSFCGDCNKLRLTASGKLRACLAADAGVDLKPILRRPHSPTAIEAAIRYTVRLKPEEGIFTAPDNMWQLGG